MPITNSATPKASLNQAEQHSALTDEQREVLQTLRAYKFVGHARIHIENSHFYDERQRNDLMTQYSTLVERIASGILSSPYYRRDSIDSLFQEVWRHIKFVERLTYGTNNNDHRISVSIRTSYWDCDNSATLFIDVIRQFGLSPAMVVVPKHALIRLGELYIETTSGVICSSKDFARRYQEVEWESIETVAIASWGGLQSIPLYERMMSNLIQIVRREGNVATKTKADDKSTGRESENQEQIQQVLEQKARKHYENGEWIDAVEAYKEYISHGPQHYSQRSEIQARLNYALFFSNSITELAQNSERLLWLPKCQVLGLRGLGLTASLRGQWEECFNTLSRALWLQSESDGRPLDALWLRAALLKSPPLHNIEPIISQLSMKGLSLLAIVERGWYHLETGAFELARRDFTTCKELLPSLLVDIGLYGALVGLGLSKSADNVGREIIRHLPQAASLLVADKQLTRRRVHSFFTSCPRPRTAQEAFYRGDYETVVTTEFSKHPHDVWMRKLATILITNEHSEHSTLLVGDDTKLPLNIRILCLALKTRCGFGFDPDAPLSELQIIASNLLQVGNNQIPSWALQEGRRLLDNHFVQDCLPGMYQSGLSAMLIRDALQRVSLSDYEPFALSWYAISGGPSSEELEAISNYLAGKYPDSAPALIAASLLHRTSDYKKAEDASERLSTLYPDDYRSQAIYGYIRSLQDLKTGEKWLRKSIHTQPSAWAYGLLLENLVQQGKQQPVEALLQLLNTQNLSVEMLLRLARMSLALSDPKLAEDYLILAKTSAYKDGYHHYRDFGVELKIFREAHNTVRLSQVHREIEKISHASTHPPLAIESILFDAKRFEEIIQRTNALDPLSDKYTDRLSLRALALVCQTTPGFDEALHSVNLVLAKDQKHLPSLLLRSLLQAYHLLDPHAARGDVERALEFTREPFVQRWQNTLLAWLENPSPLGGPIPGGKDTRKELGQILMSFAEEAKGAFYSSRLTTSIPIRPSFEHVHCFPFVSTPEEVLQLVKDIEKNGVLIDEVTGVLSNGCAISIVRNNESFVLNKQTILTGRPTGLFIRSYREPLNVPEKRCKLIRLGLPAHSSADVESFIRSLPSQSDLRGAINSDRLSLILEKEELLHQLWDLCGDAKHVPKDKQQDFGNAIVQCLTASIKLRLDIISDFAPLSQRNPREQEALLEAYAILEYWTTHGYVSVFEKHPSLQGLIKKARELDLCRRMLELAGQSPRLLHKRPYFLARLELSTAKCQFPDFVLKKSATAVGKGRLTVENVRQFLGLAHETPDLWNATWLPNFIAIIEPLLSPKVQARGISTEELQSSLKLPPAPCASTVNQKGRIG